MSMEKHERCVSGYNVKLTTYTRMVHQFSYRPLLDSNIVALLQALMDSLQKITAYKSYAGITDEELDLNKRELGLSLGCRFCKQTGFNALQLILHLSHMEHQGLPSTAMKKFRRCRDPMKEGFNMFLIQERDILIKHGMIDAAMGMLLDFYFLTKSFLKMTSDYLSALARLNREPSIGIARGVNFLLDHVISSISRAQCIESIAAYSSLLFQYSVYDVVFDCSNNVSAIPTSNTSIKFGQPIYKNSTMPEASSGNIRAITPIVRGALPPPFTQHPPIRMPMHMPAIVPFFIGPPPAIVPLQPRGVSTNHQLLYNPSIPPPSPQRFAQQNSPFPIPRLQIEVPKNCGSVLPPLHNRGTIDNPIFDEHMNKFLKDPNLYSLVESGNCLRRFETSSTIPSELMDAVRRIAPNVKVKCFGSKVSGVGYEEDSVNLYVDDGTTLKTAESIEVLYTTLKQFFESNSEDWVIQSTEENGVRTHMAVKNHCESVCCRISFASEIYCANTNIIQYYTESYPMCQKLCYYVQEFTKAAGLDFSRLIVIVLVIFFLQVKKRYLPTVQKLQSNLDEEQISAEGWLINFKPIPVTDLNLADCTTDLRFLASEFFQFYGQQLLFAKSVVSPYSGVAIHRDDFVKGNEWNLTQERYKKYLQEAQANAVERFNASTAMCLQDLLELKTNIAMHITEDATRKFVRSCQMAHEFYANNQ